MIKELTMIAALRPGRGLTEIIKVEPTDPFPGVPQQEIINPRVSFLLYGLWALGLIISLWAPRALAFIFLIK